jgi:Na+/proline symporter
LHSGQGQDAAKDTLHGAFKATQALRQEAKALVSKALPGAETKDTDYVFISFVLRYLPSGLIGLLIAVILCAAMSSTSSELAALGSTSMIDLYKRIGSGSAASAMTTAADLRLSKLFTVVWGFAAIGFATFASLVDNLIQAVNILGSIFYGTLLGLFVVAFFLRRVTATPVLIAALIAQTVVVVLFFSSDLGFLWFNVVGSGIVVVLSLVFEALRRK